MRSCSENNLGDGVKIFKKHLDGIRISDKKNASLLR